MTMRSNSTTAKDLKRFRAALKRIAALGDGIKGDMVDWANIGKMAKSAAIEALNPKCPKCGRRN